MSVEAIVAHSEIPVDEEEINDSSDTKAHHIITEREDEDEEIEEEDEMEEGTFAETPSDCFVPDMPDHLESRRLGYSALEGTIYFDYYDSGFWIPWYTADQIHDSITFEWNTLVGFYGFPDDN